MSEGPLPAQDSRLSQCSVRLWPPSHGALLSPRETGEGGKKGGTPRLHEYTAATGSTYPYTQVPQTHKAYRDFPRYTGP